MLVLVVLPLIKAARPGEIGIRAAARLEPTQKLMPSLSPSLFINKATPRSLTPGTPSPPHAKNCVMGMVLGAGGRLATATGAAADATDDVCCVCVCAMFCVIVVCVVIVVVVVCVVIVVVVVCVVVVVVDAVVVTVLVDGSRFRPCKGASVLLAPAATVATLLANAKNGFLVAGLPMMVWSVDWLSWDSIFVSSSILS